MEVRVKILFTSLCHTDVYFWEGRVQMDVIEEEGSRNEGQSDESSDDKDGKEMKSINLEIQEVKQNGIKAIRPAPIEILKNVKFNTAQGFFSTFRIKQT